MPWTTADVDRHNKGLTDKQKSVWVQVANQELASHGDEARAIKSANAAVGNMHKKESLTMEFTIEAFQEAASKVLHLDSSHSALRSKLQEHVAADHRKSLADKGESEGYYDYPYIHDVFGSEDGGQVVTAHKGQMHAQKFSKTSDGSYKLGDKKKVKQAYVQDNDADDKKESITLVLDGREIEVHEAATMLAETGDVLELQEAAKGTATAKVTLISAGKGSSGYYTEAALKKAAKDRIFAAGTQMFLNHQTKEERAARPEGDITKLAGTTTADAEYVEGSGGKPGRLVAPAKVFGPYKDFLAEAKDDIGVSVRIGATPSGKFQDGVPLVENMVYATSADFVTKAGRGGKIEEMYESYRAAHPPVTYGGNQPQEQTMTDQEKQEYAALTAKVSRLQESNARFAARTFIAESLATSGLKPRGQKRVTDIVLANVPMTADGDLDEKKLQESLKAAITEEVAYLQENGVGPRPVVRNQGPVPVVKDDDTELSEAEVAANAEKLLTESLAVIGGGKGGK